MKEVARFGQACYDPMQHFEQPNLRLECCARVCCVRLELSSIFAKRCRRSAKATGS